MSTPVKDTLYRWTTDKQYEFSGINEKEKGSLMEIVLNGTVYTTRIDPVSGEWSWKPPVELEDGQYSLSLRVIDRAQNIGAPTLVILNVDTTAPNKPEILRVVDDEGKNQGWLSPNAQTDDKTPTFSGSAEAGSIVKLYDGISLIGSAVADKNGHWEMTPETELADGVHSFTVTSTDKMGHTSAASETFDLTINADGNIPAPGVAVIDHAVDNAGKFTGKLRSGALTDDLTPELQGFAATGSVVRIQYRSANGEWIDGGNATMNGTTWSWTPDPALKEGNWEFRANAGSGWTDDFKLDIDVSPVSEITITHAWDDFGALTGVVGNGGITDDRTPTLHGRAESNSTVYIFFRNVLGNWEVLASVTAGADGRWQYENGLMSVGDYEFQAGDSLTRNPDTKPFKLKLISPGSQIPTIDYILDNVGLRQGKVLSGNVTDDTTPELRGHAESNSLVYIKYSNGDKSYIASVITNHAGEWTFNPPALTYGKWVFNSYASSNENNSNQFDIVIATSDFVDSRERFDKRFVIVQGDSITLDSNLTIKTLKGYAHSNTLYNNLRLGDYGKNDALEGQQTKIRLDIEESKFFSFEANNAYGKENEVSFYNSQGKLLGKITLKLGFNERQHYEFKAPDGELIHHIEFNNGIFEWGGNKYWDMVSLYDLHWGIGESGVSSETIDEVNNDSHTLDEADILHSLSFENILTTGQKDLFIDDGKTQMMVTGEVGDTVQLQDILPEGDDLTGWQQQVGTVTIAGVHYNVFTHGDAELLVQEGVKTELI